MVGTNLCSRFNGFEVEEIPSGIWVRVRGKYEDPYNACPMAPRFLRGEEYVIDAPIPPLFVVAVEQKDGSTDWYRFEPTE
jgi:hypothetical protein